MAAGFLSRGKCWATQQEAVDAFYTDHNISGLHYFSPNYFYYLPVKDAGVWKMGQLQLNGSLTYPAVLPTNVYGSCTYQSAGVEYNYEAAIAAWGFGFMTVVGLWLLAKHFGLILDFIRRA